MKDPIPGGSFLEAPEFLSRNPSPAGSFDSQVGLVTDADGAEEWEDWTHPNKIKAKNRLLPKHLHEHKWIY